MSLMQIMLVYITMIEKNQSKLNVNESAKEWISMTTLSITSRGQVTLRREILQHLGILPGQKIELDLLPDGRGIIKAAKPTQSIDGFIGLLAGKTKKVATIEEINAAAAQAWAGKP